ncbi:hypothetical protein ACN38_g412 [Penicillium nordicum]|uniref:Uncharacterized protein n=1 Tax=Penicillium nordicum TaxID=229535 RepID=A0A0M8PIY1_9EURO|nr:hypothetical protein ACN38_g412 [Penicillium nordicum]
MPEASQCDGTYIMVALSFLPFSSSSPRARQSIHTVFSPFYFHLDCIAITCSIQYAKFKLKLAYMVSMSAEGSSLPPDNDHPVSFFAHVSRRCATWFAKHRTPSAPHTPGPSGGETQDSHTSAPQNHTATGSLRSASTENETIASPSSITSAINPNPPTAETYCLCD